LWSLVVVEQEDGPEVVEAVPVVSELELDYL
jgi:hypothetical protein